MINIVSATKSKEIHKLELYISTIGWDIPVWFKTENTDGLSTVYNNILNQKYIAHDIKNDPDEIYVFMHDDVRINCTEEEFINALNIGFEKFDILGLAGTSSWTLKSPAVWNNSDRSKWSGVVKHAHDDKVWITEFGPVHKQCVIIDGLFIAIKRKDLEKVQFDEQFKFHHYDMDFCLSAYKNELSIGTVPIDVIHFSVGDWTKDPTWYESEKLFIEKWSQ